MKKHIFSLFLFSACLLFQACSKKDYSVRFTNNYKELIYDVVVGNAKFGDVAPGTTTAYLNLSTKSFMINGTSVSGRQLATSESVSGKGKHKFTITLDESGGTAVTEDPNSEP